jgi:5-methylcytosine-specific restriction endonuclease McrA
MRRFESGASAPARRCRGRLRSMSRRSFLVGSMDEKKVEKSEAERTEARKKHAREYQRRWRAANPEKERAAQQRHDAKPGRRLRSNELRRLRHKENPEKMQEVWRKAYQRNSKKRIEQAKQYYEKNRGRVREYRLRSIEKIRADYRDWCQRNRERCRLRVRVRNARRKAVTVGDPRCVKEFYRHVQTASRLRCYYCRRFTKRSERHVDHIVPLTKGGAHAVGNLCCACATCNLKKGAKTAESLTGQTVMVWS